MCAAIENLGGYREPEALKINFELVSNMRKNQISHENTMLREAYLLGFKPGAMVHDGLAEYLIVDLNSRSESCVHIGISLQII